MAESKRTRIPLTRGRIVAVAVGLADGAGLAAVTMRAVAAELGVEAMSLYNHVTNRADLLDGMVEAVFGEIESPDQSLPWRDGVARSAESVRTVLHRHPWAVGILDSRRAPGAATLRRHDAVLGTLRRAGFSPGAAVRAVAALDSYVYGSVLTERSLPVGENDDAGALAAALTAAVSESDFPYLVEVAREHASGPGGLDLDAAFQFGLSAILAGLEPDEG